MLLSRRLNRSFAPPDRVSVNVTLRCNLACTMCTTCYDSPELTTEEIKSIIDQTAAWGVQVFNPLGGEPFMRNDIEELLAYAVQRGFYVTVTTNGTLITEKRARGIAAIPADRLHFNVSLDGDETSHDRVRGAGMWARAIEGYRRVRAADAAAGNSRRKMLTNTILHAGNAARFPDILDEQAAMGFDGVQVLNLFRQGEDVPIESRDLWFYPEHLPLLESVSEALARRVETQSAGGYRIQNSADELRLIPRYYRDQLQPLDAPCWAGWKELYINADGAAIMCDGKLDFLNGTFGSVREQTLRQLWNSPALRQRREVVKRCSTPCVQTCYLRGSSDSATALAAETAKLAGTAVLDRLSRLRPTVDHRPDAVLRLELSDVCPCGWAGCTTPRSRWSALVKDCPSPPNAQSWTGFRDRHQIDFGRGFMGFELVRQVVQDLEASRLRFGTLAVRWRGEPLLHPEIEPILRYLLDRVGRGVADRLRVETDGRFITQALAGLSTLPVAQEWIFDWDRGHGAGVALLEARRASQTRVVVAASAVPGLDPTSLTHRFPYAPAAGRLPRDGDALWFRRTDHDHFQANAAARAELARVAGLLGLPAELGDERAPRRCRAPDTSPTVSWDGKVVLCPKDVQLHNRVGEVTHGRLSEIWRSAEVESDRKVAGQKGVPDRGICRDCSYPWSPNRD